MRSMQSPSRRWRPRLGRSPHGPSWATAQARPVSQCAETASAASASERPTGKEAWVEEFQSERLGSGRVEAEPLEASGPNATGGGESELTVWALEQWLWDAACEIRGPLDASKFEDYILPLVFLKRLSETALRCLR